MKNIELKISINNFKDIINILKRIGAHYSKTMHQIDVYYFCKNGRLKLRNTNNKNFELIFYQRPDKKIRKISNYEILKINPDKFNYIKSLLDSGLGGKNIVIKKRHLWIYRNTRIHLDIVRGLGKFLELETIVKKIPLREAKKEYNKLLILLNVLNTKIHKESYKDLLDKSCALNNKKSFQLGLESLMMPNDLFSSIQYQLKK
jgi:predicted adenylyl cyclase CyaB